MTFGTGDQRETFAIFDLVNVFGNTWHDFIDDTGAFVGFLNRARMSIDGEQLNSYIAHQIFHRFARPPAFGFADRRCDAFSHHQFHSHRLRNQHNDFHDHVDDGVVRGDTIPKHVVERIEIEGEHSFTFLELRESTDPIAQQLEPRRPTNEREREDNGRGHWPRPRRGGAVEDETYRFYSLRRASLSIQRCRWPCSCWQDPDWGRSMADVLRWSPEVANRAENLQTCSEACSSFLLSFVRLTMKSPGMPLPGGGSSAKFLSSANRTNCSSRAVSRSKSFGVLSKRSQSIDLLPLGRIYLSVGSTISLRIRDRVFSFRSDPTIRVGDIAALHLGRNPIV